LKTILGPDVAVH